MPLKLARVASLFVLMIASAAIHAQDPTLDEVIGRWQNHIDSLEDQLAEAERMYAETRNGRIYLLVLPMVTDSYENVMMTLTKDEFTDTITRLVTTGALTSAKAARLSMKAGEASKKIGPTLQKIMGDLKKELKEAKDTHRSLIDKRAKQNEALDYPNLSGAWESNYYGSWQPTRITQSGKTLTFTNERGDSSEGEFTSKTSVKATKWEGGLTATIENENRIVWANGSIWRRKGTGGF